MSLKDTPDVFPFFGTEFVNWEGQVVPVASRHLRVVAPASKHEDYFHVLVESLNRPGWEVYKSASRMKGQFEVILQERTLVAEAISIFNKMRPAFAEQDDLLVEPNFILKGCANPDDPLFPQQEYLKKVKLPSLWAEPILPFPGRRSESINVAIIDSGISMKPAGTLDHPDLKSSLISPRTNFAESGPCVDVTGHGTAVAGIIAATRNDAKGIAGIDNRSTIYIYKILGDDNTAPLDRLETAIEAAQKEAGTRDSKLVINISCGMRPDSRILRRKLEWISEHNNVLICASAGNDGGKVLFPAALAGSRSNVVAVGGSGKDGRLASLSNRGPELSVLAPMYTMLLAAPQYCLKATCHIDPGPRSGYTHEWGTSASAAIVSGITSLVWNSFPGLTAAQLRECLTRNNSITEIDAENVFHRASQMTQARAEHPSEMDNSMQEDRQDRPSANQETLEGLFGCTKCWSLYLSQGLSFALAEKDKGLDAGGKPQKAVRLLIFPQGQPPADIDPQTGDWRKVIDVTPLPTTNPAEHGTQVCQFAENIPVPNKTEIRKSIFFVPVIPDNQTIID